MRAVAIGCLAAVLASASPAWAGEFVKPMGKIILFQPSDTQLGGDVPILSRGEQFGVNCGCMGSAASDVRVVLNLTQERDQLPTGYRKLLATDQSVEHGALRVRVPDAPGLANHTVDIRVYVVDAKGAHSCDAGKVKIT